MNKFQQLEELCIDNYGLLDGDNLLYYWGYRNAIKPHGNVNRAWFDDMWSIYGDTKDRVLELYDMGYEDAKASLDDETDTNG